MPPALPRTNLDSASIIGILGDVNGDIEHLRTVSETMWKRGVGTLLAIGNLGLRRTDLDEVGQYLRTRGQTLYFHDPVTHIEGVPRPDGAHWLDNNIVHLPDGFLTTLRSHASLAILNNSLANPAQGEEPETGDPIIGNDAPRLAPADIVVGVDSPNGSPQPASGINESPDEQNEPPPLAVPQMRPKLYLSTHQARTIDCTVTRSDDSDTFETRIIHLARNDAAQLSQGILTVRTGEVALFARDDDTVTQLTGGEHGSWIVQTQTSRYVFDFDQGTVSRQPGPTGTVTINDLTRRLRTVERCTVGESGYWTMRSDGGYTDPTDYFWAVSTQIASIKRVVSPSA